MDGPIHVVRIDVDTCATDADGDDANLSAFLDRHPALATAGIGDRIRTCAGTGFGTRIEIGRLEWPSLVDYAMAIAVNDDAATISQMLDDGPITTSDPRIAAMATRANASADEALFSVRVFPGIALTHARIAIPEAAVAHLPVDGPVPLWKGDHLVMRDAGDPLVIHVVVPGLVQNMRLHLSRRLAAMGALDGRTISVGMYPMSGTAERVDIVALAARMVADYGDRMADDGGMVTREDAEPVAMEAVADDLVSVARGRGWSARVAQADVDATVDMRIEALPEAVIRAIGRAAMDPAIIGATGRGLSY